MTLSFLALLRDFAGIAGGVLIGLAFGTLQQVALRRNEARQREGRFNNGWSLIPGSGTRVAYLLIALVLVQLICPLLFADGTQWLVSGGLLAGYGWTLFTQLRFRLKTGAR
ncbi:MAG TPA: hypothetical protein VHE61_15650 [Opitutaceae bacterium]|nr:hypothetical protein [Opitutaceae bacterium]